MILFHAARHACCLLSHRESTDGKDKKLNCNSISCRYLWWLQCTGAQGGSPDASHTGQPCSWYWGSGQRYPGSKHLQSPWGFGSPQNFPCLLPQWQNCQNPRLLCGSRMQWTHPKKCPKWWSYLLLASSLLVDRHIRMGSTEQQNGLLSFLTHIYQCRTEQLNSETGDKILLSFWGSR